MEQLGGAAKRDPGSSIRFIKRQRNAKRESALVPTRGRIERKFRRKKKSAAKDATAARRIAVN